MRLTAFVAFAFTINIFAEAAKPSDAILLSKIKTLTLKNGKQTSHRRVSPIPQLQCIGGNAKKYASEVDVMRCRNVGSDYDVNDVQWTCEAKLPEDFKLGSTEVICEGYDSPDDPYVLKGSCGVEYKLQLTELGEAKYGRSSGGSDNSRSETVIGYLILAFIIGVIVYGIWDNCTGGNRRRPRGPAYGDGYGGGFGGNDDDDPPPPYTPGPSYKSSNRGTSSTNQQGRPGFWSGTMAGAAAGYMAGRYTGGGNQQNNRNSSRWGGSSWGRQDDGYGSSQRSSFGSSSASSSRTHTSTGFGGTSRR
ncbi:Store-operated calcium entry-associated regulatory factor [Sphaceloma murrayae]|uniref:Store-operated calcium entry-associated regulatory factor n=1 Tax=Sphaceloma murrayae TaxID=2082308 RepID=A0A2K1QM26_9PEZI|nr:Store-operated calcium entry-associated regulatory factor [Sphaceloma murrayae]